MTPLEIVALASEMAESTAVRQWLWLDEFGTWEQTAQQLMSNSLARATELKLSDTEHAACVANELCLMAAMAILKRKEDAMR